MLNCYTLFTLLLLYLPGKGCRSIKTSYLGVQYTVCDTLELDRITRGTWYKFAVEKPAQKHATK